MTRNATIPCRTVLVSGHIPDVLTEVQAKNLPKVGELVRIEIIGTGYCAGFAKVSRLRKNGTYDVNTRGMIPADGR